MITTHPITINCTWSYDDIDTGDAFDSTKLPDVLVKIVKTYSFGIASRYTVHFTRDSNRNYDEVRVRFNDLKFDGPSNSVRSMKLLEPLVIEPQASGSMAHVFEGCNHVGWYEVRFNATVKMSLFGSLQYEQLLVLFDLPLYSNANWKTFI